MYSTLRRYSVTLDDSTAGSRKLTFLPIKASTGNTFATSSDWTPDAADFKVAKAVTGSGLGSEASIGTAPTWVNGRVVIILSGTELTCRYLTIRIENAAIASDEIIVETYGNASAQYPTVYSGGSAGNLITSGTGADQLQVSSGAATTDAYTRLGAPAGASVSADIAAVATDAANASSRAQSAGDIASAIQAVTDQITFTNTGQVDATTLTNSDKTGYGLSSSERTSLAAAMWNALTSGMTTVGSIGKKLADWAVGVVTTNNDKTGYSLSGSQTFNMTGNITGNLSGSVGSVTGAVASVTGNVGGNVVGSVASVTGAVGSVTGAVGSVTGNVGGNVVGTVASVVGAVGSVTGNVGGNVTGTVGSLATQAKTDVENAVWNGLQSGHTTTGTFGKYLDAQVSTVGGGSAPSAATIADAVWDEALSGHTTSGSAGAKLTTAASASGGGGGTGSGANPVDHDGGDGVTVDSAASSTDILQYLKSDSSGADGLFVSAYLASEYDASPPVRTAKAVTRTGPDGRWLAPLMLDSGTYYIVADAAGDGYQAKINTVVVP